MLRDDDSHLSMMITPTLESDLQTALDAAVSRYETHRITSLGQHRAATDALPGGNTRTLLHTSPFPIYIASGQGNTVTTADGDELIDFVGELTAGIFGHSHPIIRSALVKTFDQVGMCLGGTTTAEHAHATLICKRFGMERVRFANSGTEANLYNLLAARCFTGRRKVVVFNGGYHGGVLFTLPSGEIPSNTVDAADMIVLRYNDLEHLKSFFATAEAQEVAAVLLDPMQGGGGCLLADPAFLLSVQAEARNAGALLILDEVMTSRLAPGGLHSTIPGLKPDLLTLGKYLGGGFAFGAFGGRADIMRVYDPTWEHSIPHLGTFNQNSMAMNVGYIGLKEVFTPDACVELNEQGDWLREQLNEVTKGTKLGFTGVGSLMTLHITKEGYRDRQIRNAADVQEIVKIRDLWWFEMLEEGLWCARQGSINLSLGLSSTDLERLVESVRRFVRRHWKIVRL